MEKATLTVSASFNGIKTLLKYGFCACLSLLAALIILDLRNPELLLYPDNYEGDAIFYSMMIKSVLTTGWYWTNPGIGAPDIGTLYDFPMPEALNFLIIKILALFSSNWALIQNLFFLITFPLSSLTALFVLNRIGLSYPLALAGSVLFSQLPYHFMRGTGHILLSSYFMVPLVIWLAILIYQDKLLDEGISLFRNKRRILCCVLICAGVGSTGVYYAFFGIFFLLVAGCIASYVKRRWVPLIQSIAAVSLIAVSVICNVLPSLIYQAQNGKNPAASFRHHGESEEQGLKIAQLLLPMRNDRIKICSYINKKYYHFKAPLTESWVSSLCLFGSLGFVGLIARIFLKRREKFEGALLDGLAHFNLAGVLLATGGGFSGLISFLLTPKIRSYNRISIFIYFFAIAAFLIGVQWILNRFFQKRVKSIWVVSLLVLIFGIYNQTSSIYRVNKKLRITKEKFDKDRAFFQKIESLFPSKSLFFQLPYMPFPEGSHVGAIGSYDHLRAHLHTERQKWSFGTIRGRDRDRWQSEISELPVAAMVSALIDKGFVGLCINRKGYADQGVDIEKQISELLKSTPFERDEYIFWDLRAYAEQVKKLKANSIQKKS